MANDEETSEYPDRLLGRMLAEAARVNTGADMSKAQAGDDMILQVYQQLSDSSTSASERSDAIAMLMHDPDIYARWLALTRFMDRQRTEMAAQPTQVEPRSAVRRKPRAQARIADRLRNLLAELWYNPALSTAFGLAMGVLVTAVYTGTTEVDDGAGGEVVIAQQGVPLPNKAAQGSIEQSTVSSSTMATQLGQSIRCAQSGAETVWQLCYTATSPDQQWFQVSAIDHVRTLARPIDTDKIIAVSLTRELLLIEHQLDGKFRLSLFRMNDASQGLQLTLLHEDTAVTGYFDDIAVDERGLSYVLHRDDETLKQYFAVP